MQGLLNCTLNVRYHRHLQYSLAFETPQLSGDYQTPSPSITALFFDRYDFQLSLELIDGRVEIMACCIVKGLEVRYTVDKFHRLKKVWRRVCEFQDGQRINYQVTIAFSAFQEEFKNDKRKIGAERG